MAKHLTIPGALEWDAVERHSIATLRYAGGKEHDVKYVSEVAYDALRARLQVAEKLLSDAKFIIEHSSYRINGASALIYGIDNALKVPMGLTP